MKKVTVHNHNFSVILHNVRSILNVGSIFRTADGAGFGKIYLTGYTPGPDTHPEKLAKTALGSEQSVPWERVRCLGDLIRRLQAEGICVVALEQSSRSQDYRKYVSGSSIALVLGNEVEGLPLTKNIDAVIEIPMRGEKESLNVAVAFGVVAYELTRRWK